MNLALIRRSLLVLTLVLFGSHGLLFAQSEITAKLREGIQEELIEKSLPVLRAHFADLVKLEREVAAKGDYEQAIRVAQRRLEILRMIASSGATEVPGVFYLRADDARTTTRDRTADTLGPWKISGSSARWDVPRIQPGTYLVEVRYHSSPGGFSGSDGPAFTFGEETGLGNPSPKLLFSLRPSAAPSNRKVGVVEIDGTGATFLLSLDETSSSETWIDWIVLLPAEGIEEPPVDQATPDDVTTLSSAHLRRMRLLMQDPVDAYVPELDRLLAETTAGTSAHARITAEKDRVTAGLLNPDGWTYSTVAKPASEAKASPSKVAKLRGVRFVPGTAHCGATMTLLHEGKEYEARLQYVDCPTSIGAAKFARYFGLDPETADGLASEAATFTSRYLSNKDFTFTTEWKQDPEGRYYGTVILPGLGSLQRVLVGRGLASVRKADEYSTRSDEFLLQILATTEAQAKAGGRGAWGLGK